MLCYSYLAVIKNNYCGSHPFHTNDNNTNERASGHNLHLAVTYIFKNYVTVNISLSIFETFSIYF